METAPTILVAIAQRESVIRTQFVASHGLALSKQVRSEGLGMLVVRRILVGAVMVIAIAAYGPAPMTEVPSAATDPAVTNVVTSPTPPPSGEVVWGRVPYCNCFAGSATVNVANALQEAKLTVNLKELSPRDGWLYFAVTFDPLVAAGDQVVAAMKAGGAEVLDSPP